MRIELNPEFLDANISQLTSRREKVQHLLGSLIFALKRIRWMPQNFNIEVEEQSPLRYRIYVKGE